MCIIHIFSLNTSPFHYKFHISPWKQFVSYNKFLQLSHLPDTLQPFPSEAVKHANYNIWPFQ